MAKNIPVIFKFVLMAALLVSASGFAQAAETKESAYDRIMRTGTIRCGYGLWAPMLERDANSGAMSGTWVEVTEALAKALDLKLEWTSEVNMATYLQDMQNGRFDVECGGGWPNGIRGKLAEYSIPAFYFAVHPVVRASDPRFDNDYSRINAPDVRTVTMDGETSVLLHDRLFPKAQVYAVPPSAPISDMGLSVVTGKADMVFLSTAELEPYLAQNPGTLKIAPGPPLRLIPQAYSMAGGEFRLKNMIDTALQELLNDGTIEAIIKKHETVPGTYLRIAKPYEVVQ